MNPIKKKSNFIAVGGSLLFFLFGCATTKPVDPSCVDDTMLTTQSNEIVINPTPCANNEVLAVIQPNGNIYTYDVCQKHLIQLTFDGQPYEGDKPQTDSYHFFDASESWSPATPSNQILVGRNSKAYIIDVRGNTNTVLGENIISVVWSPTGDQLAMVQTLADPNKVYDPHNYNMIFVINIDDFSHNSSFKGNAPVWRSASELVYFSVTEEAGSKYLHDVAVVNIENSHKTLCPKVQTTQSPIRYSRLSANRKDIAVHSWQDLSSNLGVLSLDKSDTFSMQWTTQGGYISDGYMWSPTQSILAICTTGEGARDGAILDKSHGAVLLVEPDKPLRTFFDQRCTPQSRVSWHPSGNIVAFLNIDHKLTFIDVVVSEYLSQPIQSDKFKIDKGPWWSPSGHYIGVISDDKIYVAEFNGKALVFEYVTEGTEISWQPLK